VRPEEAKNQKKKRSMERHRGETKKNSRTLVEGDKGSVGDATGCPALWKTRGGKGKNRKEPPKTSKQTRSPPSQKPEKHQKPRQKNPKLKSEPKRTQKVNTLLEEVTSAEVHLKGEQVGQQKEMESPRTIPNVPC